MSQRKPASSRLRTAPPPSQLREILRDIARWAVSSSIVLLAACGGYHDPAALGQDVPPPANSTGSGVGSPGVGTSPRGQAGSIGIAGSAPGTAGTGAVPTHPTPGLPIGPTVPDAGSPRDAGVVLPPQQWQNIACSNGMPQLLSNVKLTRNVDYAAIYRSYLADADAGPGSGAFLGFVTDTGQACRTARDVSNCQATLDLLRMPGAACVQRGICGLFVLTTAGDDVTRSEGRASLIALLGAIDSPEKAALVALFDGHQVPCASPASTGTQTRATGDGYDVRTELDRCGAQRYRETLHVARDGTLTRVATEIIGPSGC